MRLILVFFCSLLLNVAQSQTSPKLIITVEGIKEYELTNGLRILLMPDASQTNIAVNIVYKVGSRHEGYGESGMAHLLEHMLFKQCKKFVDIKKAIADKGASANGTTWYDRTNYYEILSASDENLRWAIDMEADRMVNSKILPEELKKEFSVVRNEFEIGENYPSGVLNERVISAMYLWHNYGKSTIGSKEDIERVKAENLKVFYKKYYQPDNAVLIIAGKFDEKKALAYCQQYFGPLPKPTRKLQPTYTVEPPQDGERNVLLRRTGDIQYIGMAYHTPSLADKDYASNDALIEILTNDPSGILYKKLVETKIASKLYGYAQTLYDPGFSYFEVEVPKDKSIDSAKHVLLTAMDDLGTMNFTEEDLTRAKNIILKSIENNVSQTTDFAVSLTEYIGAGDWRLFFLYRDRIEKLTVADIQAAAKKYYKSSNRTYGIFVPDAAPDRTVVAETPDIAKLLNGYKGKEVAAQKANFENTIENIKRNTEYGVLANGGKYALLEKPTKGDKITASVILRFGDEKSLNNKSEIGGVLAEMLYSGTTTKTKEQIADELDRIKTSISFSGGSTSLSININTDKKNLSAALALLDDMLQNPKFDAKEFDRIILDTKASYETGKSDPQTLAAQKLQKMLSNYPSGHPYYASSTDESLEELAKVKLDDVKKYYHDFYGANNSVSSFVGELDKKQIKSFLESSFGKWNSKETYKEVEPIYFESKAKTETINTPDKTNAMLLGGLNLNISRKHPDYAAVIIANELLGGGAFLSSRIPQRLRENEGMSYGAGSFMNVEYNYNIGNWGVYAMFNPLYKGRLDSALHQEIDKAIKTGFTQDELTKSVASWQEQGRTSLGSNDNLASILRSFLQNDRDLNQYIEFDNKLKNLKLDAVNTALRKYFDKSKFVMVYGGDFEKGKTDTPTEKKGF
ncbi:MAG: insulinase family protein [Chitinophagaceae bacterium]|nr:insulinase family protein [Chitinophagaceae bacterium]MBK8301122.1 insulinase family protein [Chitinophagaceae bacterium]MBK9465454.1 insulinase family protein [Chitinophagaceae bacterium]MBP6232727.1 insulinase family protein [Chitinophagaceae bacterium]